MGICGVLRSYNIMFEKEHGVRFAFGAFALASGAAGSCSFVFRLERLVQRWVVSNVEIAWTDWLCGPIFLHFVRIHIQGLQ